jgi:hypothetical protein
MGEVRLAPKEREMTAVLIIAKAVVLVGVAFAVFTGLAMALGVDPLLDHGAARCAGATQQLCLFTIV